MFKCWCDIFPGTLGYGGRFIRLYLTILVDHYNICYFKDVIHGKWITSFFMSTVITATCIQDVVNIDLSFSPLAFLFPHWHDKYKATMCPYCLSSICMPGPFQRFERLQRTTRRSARMQLCRTVPECMSVQLNSDVLRI